MGILTAACTPRTSQFPRGLGRNEYARRSSRARECMCVCMCVCASSFSRAAYTTTRYATRLCVSLRVAQHRVHKCVPVEKCGHPVSSSDTWASFLFSCALSVSRGSPSSCVVWHAKTRAHESQDVNGRKKKISRSDDTQWGGKIESITKIFERYIFLLLNKNVKINSTIWFFIVLGNWSYFLTFKIRFLALVEKIKKHRINFAPEFFHSFSDLQASSYLNTLSISHLLR